LRWHKVGSRRLLACGVAANVTLLSLWVADVGAMRDPVILGITEFDLPWPVIPLADCRRRFCISCGKLSARQLGTP
jgi:hypothetical protein